MWEIDWLKLFSSALLQSSGKKKTSGYSFPFEWILWRWFPKFWIFHSICILNYGDIISFPNKLKFDHINIFTNLLILAKKIINTCLSDTLTCFFFIALKVKFFCSFWIQLEEMIILVTGDILVHQKRIYLQKKMKVLFSSTLLRYFVTAPVVKNILGTTFHIVITSGFLQFLYLKWLMFS